MATSNELYLYLLTAEGLVRCGWDGRSQHVEILNRALDGEVLREVAQDPFDRNHLYAATITEIHVSEDGGAHWKWIPSGGIDFRDIWAMEVDPTRRDQVYVGTLPAAVYVSENGGRRVSFELPRRPSYLPDPPLVARLGDGPRIVVRPA